MGHRGQDGNSIQDAGETRTASTVPAASDGKRRDGSGS